MTRIAVATENLKQGFSAVFTVLEAIYSLRPSIAKQFEQAQKSLYTEGTISPRMRELVRLRIAFHNQCRTCMAVRYAPQEVSEGLVCSLEKPAEAADLTAAERVALNYADLFALNHFAIDEKIYEALRKHFSEGEIVELGYLCATFVGFGRLAASWNMLEVLPESFQQPKGRITPWGHEKVLSIADA
jgi:alkylhydroperoxidase family enzyme